MSRTKKKFLATLAACCAGTVLQTGLVTTNCAQFYAEAALTTFDPCTVFNCTGGTFFDLCEPYPLFATCPNYQDWLEQNP